MKSYKFREIESSYLNISFIVFKINLLNILKDYTNSNNINFKLNNILTSNVISYLEDSNLNKISFIKLLILFNEKHAGYDSFILKSFLNLLKEGNIDKVINIKINKKASNCIVFNFNLEKAVKYIHIDPEIIKDRVLEYAGAFYYFSLIGILYLISGDKVCSLEEKNKFCFRTYKQLRIGILTGFSAYTELETTVPAEAVIEELLCLSSADEKRLVITKNPNKNAIEFKIKNNMIFQERYNLEGYNNLIFEEDTNKDRNLNDYFRISKGSSSNSIRLFYKKASGYRTLSRIFCFGESRKIHINQLYDSGMQCVRNMLLFCLHAILDNCNYRDIKISKYGALDKYIRNYRIKEKRYVSEKIAVIVLIATHPELEEEIIKKYFKNSIQRNEILKEVKKLRRLINQENEFSLVKFKESMRFYYAW